MLRNVIASAVLLTLFAIVGSGLVATVHDGTRERIARNEEEVLLRGLHDVLPEREYDNDILRDALTIDAPDLGGTIIVYPAFRGHDPVALIYTVTAPDGYAGPIRLLVGVTADGRVSGVRVVAHRETPGLGDDIDASRSDWIERFRGLSLDSPPTPLWNVRRDGGVFDQFTGATITPRAVVKAIRTTLLYSRDHCEGLYERALQRMTEDDHG
ncbi:MAG: electron transport complex subunit RsxG [Chromatiales bacterium]|nr:electron transport complex subunit RsxG [Chromatiales bacterium]